MIETPTRPRLQGRLEWFDSKSIHIQARFDKLAVYDNRLMLVSLVAFSQDVKAFRAGLAAGLNVPMRLRDVTLTRDEETIAPNDVWPSGHGYRVDAHWLGYGMLHAIFTTRQPGFLLDDSDDALWQQLKQERFTTPLLRSWLPHVRKELEACNLLQRCHACVLTAMSSDLDSIVESGLKNDLNRAMQLMARKMAAAMALDGELWAEGLTAMADDESAAMALARSISNTIDTADIQRNWAKVSTTRKATASPLVPLGLADIEEEPIDGLDILAIEPHLIARTILECREEDCEIPLSRDVLARMFEECVSISDEELDALCSA